MPHFVIAFEEVKVSMQAHVFMGHMALYASRLLAKDRSSPGFS